MAETAESPHVVIRADGSSTLGRGHLVRCRNLARALEQRGFAVTFVRSGVKDDFLVDEDVRWIPGGSSPEGDAEATLGAVSPIVPEVVVVDHYGLDAVWERTVAGSGAEIVVIDDLADRDHACHLLIDQNPLPAERYDGRVPEGTRMLVGMRFALLPSRGPVLDDDAGRRLRRSEVTRLLVGFGGGGDLAPIVLALDALDDPRFATVAVDLVIGADERVEEVRSRIGPERGDVRVHGWVEDLSPLTRSADVALGAGGISVLERLHAGLPAVVVSVADNQEATCRALHEQGLLIHAGRLGAVGPREVAEALDRMVRDVEARQRIREQGPRIVDGRGAERCADAIAAITRPVHRRTVS